MVKEKTKGTPVDPKTEKEVYAGNLFEAEISNKEARSENKNMAAHNNYTAEIKDNEIAQKEKKVEKERNGFVKGLIKAFQKQPTALQVFEISIVVAGFLEIGSVVANKIKTYTDFNVNTPGINLNINKDDTNKVENKKVEDNGEVSKDDEKTNTKNSGGAKNKGNPGDGAKIAEEEGKSLVTNRDNTKNESISKEDNNKVSIDKNSDNPEITGTENDIQYEDGIRGRGAESKDTTPKDAPATVKETPKETPQEPPLEKPAETKSFEDSQKDTKTHSTTETQEINGQEWTFEDL